jgi:chitodextrinase
MGGRRGAARRRSPAVSSVAALARAAAFVVLVILVAGFVAVVAFRATPPLLQASTPADLRVVTADAEPPAAAPEPPPPYVAADGLLRDRTPPTSPSGLAATTRETSVVLTWAASRDDSGVAGYRVYRDGRPAGAADDAPFTFGRLACGTSFTLGVEAYDAAGNVSPRAEVVAATTACPPDPVVTIAGDIAAGALHAEKTATLIDAIGPTAVLTAGDNAYSHGTLAQFRRFYEPTWGRHRAKTHPTPGNHEYGDPAGGAKGYFDYFGERAGERGKGWYSFELGEWLLIALNSNCDHVGGCGRGSPQYEWLKAELERSQKRCTLAYWHHARFSSGKQFDDGGTTPFWELLYLAGAEIVVGAHDHNYQRYAPVRPDGRPDPERGIRQFVVGTGGKGRYALQQPGPPTREAGTDAAFGVLELTLRRDGYDWRFVAEASSRYTDSGSGACR